MSDYITKEEIVKECIRYANHEHNVQFKSDVSERRKHDADVVMYVCDYFKRFAEKIPSADVRENIHGHWEPKYPTREEMIYCQERYFCSNCKGYVVDRVARLEFNFCPNCGADMRGET